MRRFLTFALVLFCFVAAPVAAQECGWQYPAELCGVEVAPGDPAVRFWLTPTESLFTPWGMPDFPQPPNHGYVGDLVPMEWSNTDGESGVGLVIQLQGMNNIFGDVFAPPLGDYGAGPYFEFDQYAQCYLRLGPGIRGAALVFEAWTIGPDGLPTYTSGCFDSSGGPYSWFEFSDKCPLTTFTGIEVPEWKVRTRRVSANGRLK